MAEYFTARNLPVPAELSQNPLTRWRRLLFTALSLAILYIGLLITDIDISHSNPHFASRVITKRFRWDTSILTPQNEFETWWDTPEGLMVITLFLGTLPPPFIT